MIESSGTGRAVLPNTWPRLYPAGASSPTRTAPVFGSLST